MKIPERQDQLDTLTRKYLTDPEPNGNGNGRRRHTPLTKSDEEVIEKARSERNGKFERLFRGDLCDYDGDHSRGDDGFVYKLWSYTQDEGQVRRIHAASGLHRPEKSGRRTDYLQRSINRAQKNVTWFYEWPEDGHSKSKSKFPESSSSGEHFTDKGCNDAPAAGRDANNKRSQADTRERRQSYAHSDLGNAERLVYHHGSEIRFCHPWSTWLFWDNTRWIVDECAKVMLFSKETVRTIYGEAEAAANEGERKAIAQHALRSESRQRLEAMLALAQSEPGIPVRIEDLDRDPWLLNVQNGTIDLKTGELREHRRRDLITKLAPTWYDPEAVAPIWEGCLERVLPSVALRRFVQKVVGYSLTGAVSEQILLFLYGVGANGKSTFLNTVMEMLGDYAIQSAPDLLTVKQGAHPTELADLMGARFVASIEVEDGRRLAESLVKQMTGGDKIKARRMRQDFFQFSPTHKLFLAANHKPVVRGTDHAIWRRIKMIPFEVTIPKDEQNPKLTEKLRAELPGILAWAVRGCLDWQREGLGEPDEVKNATASYRADMDVLQQFIDECCFEGPNASVETTAFFGSFRDWCAGANEHAGTQKALAARMEERGFEKGKHPSTRRALWKGIGLYTDRGPETPDGERSTSKPLGGPKPFEAFSEDNTLVKGNSSVYTEKPLRTPSTEAIPSGNGPEDPAEDYNRMVEERARDVSAALDDGQGRVRL